MVGGQAIDLAAVKPGPHHQPTPIDVEGLQAMHLRKTGALIRAAVGAGAVMGGGDDRLIGTLDTYAIEIGLAFQIVDDILDEEGSVDTLGKTAGKDRAAGKPTYPSFFGLDRSRSWPRRAMRTRGARSSAPGFSIRASPTSPAGL